MANQRMPAIRADAHSKHPDPEDPLGIFVEEPLISRCTEEGISHHLVAEVRGVAVPVRAPQREHAQRLGLRVDVALRVERGEYVGVPG
jgi:hypothetical protein